MSFWRDHVVHRFDKKNAEGSHKCAPAGSDDPRERVLQDIQKERL